MKESAIAEFSMTDSVIAEFGIMCRWREFYIAEFDITKSAISEFGITESATAEFGIMCGWREFYIAEFDHVNSGSVHSSLAKLRIKISKSSLSKDGENGKVEEWISHCPLIVTTELAKLRIEL